MTEYNIPDRTTKSSIFRPCCLKLLIKDSKEEFGAGMNRLAPLKLDSRESFLPSNTSHLGPPLFKTNNSTSNQSGHKR